jgi:hypothetical protein
MAPFPDVLLLDDVPAFVEHLLREFSEPSSLRAAPPRTAPERTATVPPMEWEVSVWSPGSWEVRLARPITPGLEPRLQVKSPAGWSLRCTGTKLGLLTFRIDAESDTWTRVEEAIQKFWAPELEWLWPPAVPRKWRKFPSRKPTASIIRHANIIPGGEVLLASLSAQQPPFALSISGEGRPLSVSLLGPVGLRSSNTSERWICELRPGAPLPRLADVYPGAFNHPYEFLPDAPRRDRQLEEGDLYGLLLTRRGGPGRELYEVHRSHDALVRECRFAPGPEQQVTKLVPDDPTVWTVEWAVNGNYNYLAGHPGSASCVFGRSLPPEPGATRTYELLLHGIAEPTTRSWQARLTDVGLSMRERQPLRGP